MSPVNLLLRTDWWRSSRPMPSLEQKESNSNEQKQQWISPWWRILVFRSMNMIGFICCTLASPCSSFSSKSFNVSPSISRVSRERRRSSLDDSSLHSDGKYSFAQSIPHGFHCSTVDDLSGLVSGLSLAGSIHPPPLPPLTECLSRLSG